MILGIFLGFAAGVLFLTFYNTYQEEKEFEEELAQIFDEMEKEVTETFTYDCLNDSDPCEGIDNHIPKIN